MTSNSNKTLLERYNAIDRNVVSEELLRELSTIHTLTDYFENAKRVKQFQSNIDLIFELIEEQQQPEAIENNEIRKEMPNPQRGQQTSNKPQNKPSNKARNTPKTKKQADIIPTVEPNVAKLPKIAPDPIPSTSSIHPEELEHLTEDVRLLKRFLGFINRVKTKDQILHLYKDFNRRAIERKVNKKSEFKDEVEEVITKVTKLYKEVIKQKLDKVKVETNKAFEDRIIEVIESHKIRYSVNLLKRYVTLEGKDPDKKKAVNLLNAIEKSFTNGMIGSKDRYMSELNKVKDLLTDYMHGKTDRIALEPVALSGIVTSIKGTDGLGCPPLGSGVITAEQMANRIHHTLQFQYPWDQIVGEPEKNFTMMVHGEPNGGKTVLLLKFSKYLADNFYQRAIYITSEEFESSTMTQKVNKYMKPQPSNLHFSGSVEAVTFANYDLVIIDSITDLKLKLADFKELKAQNKDTAFILVLQRTKAGEFKGEKGWEHEVQIAGEVADGAITIYRNRFGRIYNEPFNFLEI